MLPVTKSIQKELLPILTKPTIDYVVDDCIKAGIQEFIIVVNSLESQIRDYYSPSKQLENYLSKYEKTDQLGNIRGLVSKAEFKFIIQKPEDGYGTAIPLKLAEKYLAEEDAFLMFLGDDFVLNDDGSSEAEKMIRQFEKSNLPALATFIPIHKDEVYKYGIARYKTVSGQRVLQSIVEKPEVASAPSNLANISKYIFTPKIFSFLKKQRPDKQLNELLLTDTVTDLVRNGGVVVYETQGRYYDCGNLEGWLKTNVEFALKDSRLRRVVLDTVRSHAHTS